MKLGPNQTAWVKALRSGRYPQGSGALMRLTPGTSDINYCCLGVACDLAGLHGERIPSLDEYKLRVRGLYDFLPLEAQDFLALKDREGHSDTTYPTLAEMNDDGISFSKIADFIEAHADLLFEEPR